MESFRTYCLQHPEERFWQALRNWSNYPFILTTKKSPFSEMLTNADLIGTFYFEEKETKHK